MAEVQDAVEDSQETRPKKKIRWRRHSLSSVHMQSIHNQAQLEANNKPQTDSTHRSSSLSRARHHSSSVEPTSSTKSHKIGGSFFKMFRSKATKNRRVQRANSQELDTDKPPILLEHKNNYVRVVATELHPRIQYKTLPITEYTTAYEVVVKLVTKFATNEADRDRPDLFYLNEEQESEQGKYSHMLENNERVHTVQSRWMDSDKNYSFVLCRRQNPLLDDCTFLQPMSAVVLSPSQDSFYNALPGLITVEEGGATPSSQTDHLMNTYFQPPLLQNEQRRNGNTKHRVHLQTSAIATPPIATASLRVGTEGNRMGDTCTTTKEPSTTAGELAQHHTLHSALPISPGELSAKEASTVKILSSDDRQSTPTGEGRMDEHNNQFLFPQPVEQRDVSSGPSKANRPVGEMNYKQLMQRSISQGMPGIMNKVIYESKHGNVVLTSAQNPTSTESSSASETTKIATDSPKEQTASVQPSLSHVKPLCHSPGIGMGSYSTGIESDKRGGNEKLQVISESTKLRTLVCSPMEAASRKFPEFVFAPGTTPASSSVCSTSGDLRTNSAEITTGGDVGDENQIHNSQIVQSNVSMSTVTVNEGRKGGTHSGGSGEKPVDGSKCDTKSKRLARKLEFNYEGDQVYAKSKSHLKTKICDQSSRELQDGATAASYDQLGPCGHHSRSVVPVTAETTLTISFKYHSRASLYPSFLRSAYYSTEMDIMESLHTLLDMKFKERVQEKGHRSARVAGGNHPVPTTESLMDEARRSHLIFSKETPKKAANVSLKRPHSFHYRRTKSEVNSAESANLESPIKREFLLRKAAEAVNQRKKKSFSEKESNLDALVEEQRSKPQRVKMTAMVHTGIGQSPRGSQGSQGSNNDYAKSMENLTMSDARYSGTIPESSPYTQKQLSSSSYSLHALPSRHVSFRESSSSQRTNSQRRALPKRSKSFHESSKSSQSLEALHVKSDLLREEGDEELLYTFERRKRPVTVLVRSNSSLAVHNGQTSAEAKLLPPRTKYQPSSNLMTTKARSSQGLALYETTEDRSCNHSVLEGSQKRYSRNRPTSAPSERPSHSRDQDRESSGLDGLMSSIHLKADKLWWNEL